MKKRSGSSIHLFRLFGIDVFLHWSWILVAVIEFQWRRSWYDNQLWNIAEYLTLFAIVLTHEFGHSLACRSVGGVADRIMLWPLGGVAFVNPPPRPGAMLWSIVAGPLVNVLLIPVTLGAYFAFRHTPGLSRDLHHYLYALAAINTVLLIFNLLPIYPLDGGQILRSLLWFIIGRANSLMVASIVGVIGAAGFGLLALYWQNIWLGVIAIFAVMQCWVGVKQARYLRTLQKLPRHEQFACPECGNSPPMGNWYRCDRCQLPFDTFVTGGRCPNCGATFDRTRCLHCGQMSPIAAWARGAAPAISPAPLAEVYVPPSVN